ncbi:MAG: Sensor histidine kinase [Massilia sp.]|nr:Sensor histidine kinase [Massilia sp.]
MADRTDQNPCLPVTRTAHEAEAKNHSRCDRAPLILALCAGALFVRHQAVTLARQQRATIEQAYLASKEAELKHYVALATRSVAQLYDSGRSDPATL